MLTDFLRSFLGSTYDEMDQTNKRWLMLGTTGLAVVLIWIIIAVGGDTIEDIIMFGLFGGFIYLILSKGVKIRVNDKEITSVEPVIKSVDSSPTLLHFGNKPQVVRKNVEETENSAS